MANKGHTKFRQKKFGELELIHLQFNLMSDGFNPLAHMNTMKIEGSQVHET